MDAHLLPFCFPASSRLSTFRLEDFPTSPTSTAKQEFLYVVLFFFMGFVIDTVLNGSEDKR